MLTVTALSIAPAARARVDTGELDIDFTADVLDSRIICTRNSVKWAWTSAGLMVPSGVNTLPLERDPFNEDLRAIGRRIERSVDNLVTQPRNFGHSDWFRGTSTPLPTGIAPGVDGTAGKGFRFQVAAVAQTFLSIGFSAVAGQKYCGAICMKENGTNSLPRIGFATASGSGAGLAAADVSPVQDWRRYHTIWTADATATRFFVIDNRGNATVADVLLDCASITAEGHLSSFTETTRAADVVSFAGIEFLDLSKGTIIGEFEYLEDVGSGFPTVFAFRDGSEGNRIIVYANAAIDDEIWGAINSGGVEQMNRSSQSIISVGGLHRAGIAYEVNDGVVGHNGTVSSKDTAISAPAIVTAGYLGSNAGADIMPSIFRRFTYNPLRSTDSAFAAALLNGSTGGGTGGGGGTTNKLRWNPNVRVPLSSGFRTITLTGSGPGASQRTIINLNPNEHAKIVLPNNTWNGGIQVNGDGNNVVHVIGGHIRKAFAQASTMVQALVFNDVQKIYCEGLWLDKGHYAGTGIMARTHSGRPLPEVWMQNMLITGCNYMDSSSQGSNWTQHGDWMQLQSQVRFVNIDLMTAYVWNTGFVTNTDSISDPSPGFANQFTSGGAIVDICEWSRVNVKHYDPSFNPGPNLISGFGSIPQGCLLYFFADTCNSVTGSVPKTRYRLSEVYATDLDNNRKTLISILAPGPSQASGCPGSITGDSFTGQYRRSEILVDSTFVTGGEPPAGDFVNAGNTSPSSSVGPSHAGGFNGLNYVTPGYQE
jgi:hypothetical protein